MTGAGTRSCQYSLLAFSTLSILRFPLLLFPTCRRWQMHAVVRRYTGVSSLIDEMEHRYGEVEQLLSGIPGFNAYYAVRDGDALTTITVCDDSAGTTQSTGLAAQWVQENLPNLTASAPDVLEGDVFLTFTKH
jgi:hypothetical protein